MANDGLQQLMSKGVVLSGNEAPVYEMAGPEAIHAFAAWLNYLGADGSVAFDQLAQNYVRSQGWEIKDPHYMRKLKPPPDMSGTDEDRKFPAQPRQVHEGETSVRVTAPVAVVIDGDTGTRGVDLRGPDEAEPAPAHTISTPDVEEAE